MVQGIGEVVEAPDATDAEEGDRAAFGQRLPRRQQSEHARTRPDHEKEQQRRRCPGPGQAVEQAARQCPAEQHEQHHHQQPFGLLGIVVQPVVIIMLAFGRADRQRRDEDGEESVAVHHLGDAVGDEGNAQRDEAIPRAGQSGAVGQPEDQPGQRTADGPADHDPRSELPDHVDHEPFEGPCTRRRAVDRGGDGQFHEGKGERVIEARLGGEGEAHLILLAGSGRANLDVRSQDRVRRRQRGADQKRRRCPKPEQQMADKRDADDRERHRDAEHAPGQCPAPPAKGPVELQPRAG